MTSYTAPAIGRAVQCPADARAVYHRHFPGATPATDWTPKKWATAMFRSRTAELAYRLADLAATERPGDLIDEWARTYEEVQRLAAELARATTRSE
ncbi:hypothetical protein [Nocardia rhamnosiphila]|uniref:Uncharacterized protein n=1 Tax=Nocardia rhamnosiphila TaxID=426716 RepID=A0ABV2WZ16_9NOCA